MHKITLALLATFLLVSNTTEAKGPDSTKRQPLNTPHNSAYATVNGLKMYYEVYGAGEPLILIHGGGSTIQTSFEKIIPRLARHHEVIAMELQAHGRTADRKADLSFKQDAEDVVALMKKLNIKKADILGFSNGGQTAIEIAINYPQVVNKLVLACTFYERSAASEQFWKGFDNAKCSDMPQSLKDGFLAVNNSPAALTNMFNKDVKRMKNFAGWTDEQMKSIKAPTLVINSIMDVGTPESALKMYRTIPDCQLVILPGGHGEYLGEKAATQKDGWHQAYITDIVENFLITQ